MAITLLRTPQPLLRLNCYIESDMTILRVGHLDVQSGSAAVGVTEIGFRSLKFVSNLRMPIQNCIRVRMEVPLERSCLIVEGELHSMLRIVDDYEYEVAFTLEGDQRQIWVQEVRRLALKQDYRFQKAWRSYGGRL